MDGLCCFLDRQKTINLNECTHTYHTFCFCVDPNFTVSKRLHLLQLT